MEQASFAEYKALYGEELDQAGYDRLAWQAKRAMDGVTTGVDGVRKLDAAPPAEEYGAQAVKRCQMALVHLLHEMEMAAGTVTREDGTVTGRAVTSITAGAESVTFAAPAGTSGGSAERQRVLRETAEEYLDGVADANGVPLLYGGIYPVKLEV